MAEDANLEFADDAFHELRNDPNQFEEFVKLWEVGVWANGVNTSFDKVTRRFEEMDKEYRGQFHVLTNYLNEWIDFRTVRSGFSFSIYLLTLSTTTE